MIIFCPYDWKHEGASEDDIRQIPKYKFQKMEEPEKQLVCLDLIVE
jgi:hypothetical protein